MGFTNSYDVAVVGAGVFGAWTTFTLQRAGQKVLLLDAFGPGNSRSSSGDESRVIRMGYGTDEIYSRMAMRSLELWKEFCAETAQSLFYQTGVLWMAVRDDAYAEKIRGTLEKLGVRHERIEREELDARYPQVNWDRVDWGLLEVDSGVLTARRAVAAVVEATCRVGTEYRTEAVVEPEGKNRLAEVKTVRGVTIRAGNFIFACGPWMGRLFPRVIGERIFATRQEVFYFGVPRGEIRFAPPAMPVCICITSDEMYSIPDLEGRGFKVAHDRRGPAFDPDVDDRVVTREGLAQVREYLARRFPAMRDAPVLESRVCQYENTWNGDFLIDRHPELENVWLVGGGSGHGFKHGPAVGEYVARLVMRGGATDERFALGTKAKRAQRGVY